MNIITTKNSFENKEPEIKGKVIRKAQIARQLLHKGQEIIDVKADRSDPDGKRSVFVFKDTDEFQKVFSELLEEKTGVVVEMAGNDYLVFISTVMDSDEDFDRLIESLRILDESVDNESDESGSGSEEIFMVDTSEGSFQIKDAVGRRVTDYIYVYPPGIPIIAPYEIIEEKHVAEILHDIRCGYSVRSGKK